MEPDETGIRVGAGSVTQTLKRRIKRKNEENCKWIFTAIIVHQLEKCAKREMSDVSEPISMG